MGGVTCVSVGGKRIQHVGIREGRVGRMQEGGGEGGGERGEEGRAILTSEATFTNIPLLMDVRTIRRLLHDVMITSSLRMTPQAMTHGDEEVRGHGGYLCGHQVAVLHAREVPSVEYPHAGYLHHHHGCPENMAGVVTPELDPIDLHLLGMGQNMWNRMATGHQVSIVHSDMQTILGSMPGTARNSHTAKQSCSQTVMQSCSQTVKQPGGHAAIQYLVEVDGLNLVHGLLQILLRVEHLVSRDVAMERRE